MHWFSLLVSKLLRRESLYLIVPSLDSICQVTGSNSMNLCLEKSAPYSKVEDGLYWLLTISGQLCVGI